MKFIKKKFIRELSKMLDCNVCFQCLNDPLECSQCQNIWCRICIEKNEGKCPNKCQSSDFKKPHRIIRQLINEFLIYCDTCKKRIQYIDQENHKQICFIEMENQKRKLSQEQQVLPLSKPRKIIKKEQLQKDEKIQDEIKSQYDDDSEQDKYESQSTQSQDLNSKQSKDICDRIYRYDLEDIFWNTDSIQTQIDNSQIFEVKQENLLQTLMKQQQPLNNDHFKQMSILQFIEDKWEPLEQQINNELNFKVIEFLQQNESSNDMIIQIRNNIFDFSRFESYEVYSTLRVDDQQENSDTEDEDDKQLYYVEKNERKNKVKFIAFKNENDLLKYMNVYFLSESDRVYYEDIDKQTIIQQFLKYPHSTDIQTTRSSINFQTMKEFNGTKLRDFKFEIFY